MAVMAGNGYIFDLNEGVERTHVRYRNRFGIMLAADLYVPAGTEAGDALPAAVVGPPYSGVKEQGPGVWANELARAGFVALAFDPSYNGESAGEPRHVSSPDIFTEDFMAGVDYLGMRPFVNRSRIGAVGICGSGAFALAAAAVDVRIRAVVTASMVDISGNAELFYTPEARREHLVELAEKRYEDFGRAEAEVVAAYPEEPVERVPDGLDPMTAEFRSFYATPRGHHARALGGFTTTSDYSFFNFRLLEHLGDIAPRPVLMLTGEDAQTRPLNEGIFDRFEGNAELVVVPGANHVDLYDDTEKIPFAQVESFLAGALE